jgi:hypothetical protein
MGSRSFPEISCIICSKPLDLSVDLCTDEYGKAVHTECYVKRLTAGQSHQGAVEKLFAILSVQSPTSLLYDWRR